MKSQKSVTKLKKECWRIFSQYIRLRDSRTDGYALCYTCFIMKPWKEMDAGHWRKRNLTPTLFDERNVHAQCQRCNRFQDGKPEEFRRHLIKQYGEGIDDELFLKSKGTKRFKRSELEEMIARYKKLVKDYKKIIC